MRPIVSSASFSAARNSGVPGLAFFSAIGTAFFSTTMTSNACAANWFAVPLPYAFSNSLLNCMPSALLALLSGSFSATTAGPDETNEPSTSAPPTRIRSIVAAPCVW